MLRIQCIYMYDIYIIYIVVTVFQYGFYDSAYDLSVT